MKPSVWHYTCPETGLVLPWYTAPALRWLLEQEKSSWRVLEFGAGLGSAWWRSVAGVVHSVDHDMKWSDVCVHLRSNAQSYVEFGQGLGPFDCIIVDGEWRIQCMRTAFDRVKLGGYVILDNANRAGLAEARERFRFNACLQFPQPNHPDWRTDVWHVTTKDEPPSCYTASAEAQEAHRWPL